MDGYAVRADDLTGDNPVQLRVVEDVAAGRFPSRDIGAGEAMRVMTGAPVPGGADSVVRHEDTDNGRNAVTVRAFRDARRNIRRKGEDFSAGDRLFDPGEALDVPHIGVLASAGIRTVSVYRRPRVALFSSGNELVSLADYSAEDVGRRIVSSNSVTLAALVADAGGIPRDLGIAEDNIDSVRGAFETAMDADLIVTSAGVSVGDHDHLRDAFASLGGELNFWRVKMRPGAPLAFGMLGDTPWLGLSGNPVSAMVTFELFVRPVIRKMLGFRSLFRQTISVRLAEKITLAASLMHFLRVSVTRDADGVYVAALAGSQSSSVITAMARADALLIAPGDRLELAEGETLRALPLGSGLDTSHQLVLT